GAFSTFDLPMAKKLHLLLLPLALLFAGCANITAPTGGKRDILPPKVVRLSPADSLLNTRPQKIELTFDEYITVSDANKEITISPLLSRNLVVTSHGKTVTIKLPDSLLEPQTTYRISLGKAIRDLHENNPYTNHAYTFSTGSYFDSLELSGLVLNAVTGLPDTGGKVLLYATRDTGMAILRKAPMYLTAIQSNGRFTFKGLPPGRTFRLYALRETNDNLTYDDASEWVAFYDKVVQPGDSLGQPLRLFRVDTGTTPKDTLSVVRRPGRLSASDKNQAAYRVNVDTTDKKRRSFDINHPIRITFANRVTLNHSKINLYTGNNDSLQQVPINYLGDSTDSNVLVIAPVWKPETSYTLKLSKGFAKDTGDRELPPSRFAFTTMSEDDYGTLKVQLADSLGSEHLVFITREKDTVYLKPITNHTVILGRLMPGKYTARLINDENHNGKWDNGDLKLGRQPEIIRGYPEEINLKAGWEQVIDFGR
ncbi:MAG: hypothetical protein EBZ77_11670, partial [Chitinophagia bacterium]|nr:hypothetical protein [Chitinophagia bacterium]